MEKIKKLNPNQIITLNDYPIRNEQILKLYFRMVQKAEKIVPPCPVIHQDLIIPSFSSELNALFLDFKKKNIEAEFFMLDGSHKTTATTLANKKISALVIDSNKSIEEAQELVNNGELMSLTIGKNIREVVQIINTHFSKHKNFETVEKKTRRLVKDKLVPDYMINYFGARK